MVRLADSSHKGGLHGNPCRSHPDIRAAHEESLPPLGETALSGLRRVRHTGRSFFMRVAKLPQLSPNRHASNTSPSFGHHFYRRVLMPVNAGLELRSKGLCRQIAKRLPV